MGLDTWISVGQDTNYGDTVFTSLCVIGSLFGYTNRATRGQRAVPVSFSVCMCRCVCVGIADGTSRAGRRSVVMCLSCLRRKDAVMSVVCRLIGLYLPEPGNIV